MTAVAPLVAWGAETFRQRLDGLIDVYIAAMEYPPEVAHSRAALWAEHSRRTGFACVVAESAGRAGGAADILGLAYGYHGAPGQWWYSEVRRGLGEAAAVRLANFFELTELHVRPDLQGHGLGEALLRALAARTPEPLMMLSTPEGENRAWRLYRRLGFAEVLRHFRFTGDPRPFGVLEHTLPLDLPPGTAR
jgi:ribosomal protein S18 acetylase RimI-like enzyme